MPSILKIEYDPATEFCELIHGYNKRFVDFVKLGVKPTSYRRYDVGTKKWFVHISRLTRVISVGKRYFEHVDYRSLPDDLQIEIVKKLGSWQEAHTYTIGSAAKDKAVSPYDVLFLHPQAPWIVVKAAYKALVQLHHPDRGGDEEAFKELQTAFDSLKKDLKN